MGSYQVAYPTARRPASLADSAAAATRHTIRTQEWHKLTNGRPVFRSDGQPMVLFSSPHCWMNFCTRLAHFLFADIFRGRTRNALFHFPETRMPIPKLNSLRKPFWTSNSACSHQSRMALEASSEMGDTGGNAGFLIKHNQILSGGTYMNR